MKQFISIIILLLFVNCKRTFESNKIAEESNKELAAKECLFPGAFLGIYKGDLINTSSNSVEIIPMEFHLLATSDSLRYDYKIYYGAERSERAYTLIQTENPHIYKLDENNGIVIPVAYSKNTLFSTYEVAGSLLNNSEVFYKDRMDFMITMSVLENKEETGESGGYKVSSYPIYVIQQATLIKVKKQQHNTAIHN
jgi:hypothetical protein